MSTRAPNPTETVVLSLIAAFLLFGLASAWVDVTWFEQVYAVEDGPVEWATAVALFVAAGVSAWTAFRPGGGRHWLHRATWFGLTLVCFFAAGEEISWGQRLLGVESPEFFLQHNAQRETNLHNLVLGGVKVNKLVFSQLMIVVAAAFLFGLPALHRRNAAFARLVDAAGVPVPTLLQIVAIVGTFALIGLVPSRERDELLELGASAIFVLILLFPRNVAAVRRPSAPAALPEETASSR